MTWNLHSHSKFSAGDALPSVAEMVDTVNGYGQEALGLTDHGNMAGAVQLYTECASAGIKPFPGSELYVVQDRGDKRAKRHHMCVVAFTTEGYQNLVRLSSLTGTNFFNKPLIDHADLAQLGSDGLLKGIAATSGCYFGYVAQAIVRGDEQGAMGLLGLYASCFDRFYVELQNHGIKHDEEGWDDDRLATTAMTLADRMGLPCVLTQDAHYAHFEDQQLHNNMKRLVAYGPDPDDATFPGDGFGLADDEWFRTHHDEQRYQRGSEGLADLLGAHDLSIPQLDNYHYNIPFTVADPQREMATRAAARLTELGLADKKAYFDRFVDEVATIKDTGMAGYLVLVAEVTDWCRDNEVFYQARGSASGSIVCWLLGITQLDPVKWGLSFERFISRDRTKPPDIDLDIEGHRRQDLIEWLRGRFAIVQIGTWTKFSLHGDENEEGVQESRGSLRVRYYTARNKRGEAIHEWADVPQADKDALEALSLKAPYSSHGTHAAGLVVSSSASEIEGLVPTMLVASSKTTVTQFDMGDIEALGLVKLDVLGLRTLSVLHRCMENLGREVSDGLDWIPLRDTRTFTSIARGDTAGVFQLEGWSARKGCRLLKPTKIADIIAAMALFRPATMSSGATDDYIERKHGEQAVPIRNPIVDAETKSTYGVLLFQEQVISVLRQIGLTADDLTKFLKAVKASNQNIGDAGKVIQGYKDLIWELAVNADFTKRDWEWFWECCTGFAAYGFNQAHSTAYGLTAYRCAYLATNHPLEFYAALLAYADSQKKTGERRSREDVYLDMVRDKKIRVMKADVNSSDVTYTADADRAAIRKGLASISGIGVKTAVKIVAHRPVDGYASIEEFCRLTRVSGSDAFLNERDLSVGIIGKLAGAKALMQLPETHDPHTRRAVFA